MARPWGRAAPWAAARPRAVRAASFARRVASKPGQAPPPPTGTAARPSGPSGALHTGALVTASIQPKPHHHLQAPPGPTNVACNSLTPISNHEFTAAELQRFQTLLNLHQIELHAKFWNRRLRRLPVRHGWQARHVHTRPWPGSTPRPRPRRWNVRSRRLPRPAHDPRSAPRTRRRGRSRRNAHARPGRASRTGNRCASLHC